MTPSSISSESALRAFKNQPATQPIAARMVLLLLLLSFLCGCTEAIQGGPKSTMDKIANKDSLTEAGLKLDNSKSKEDRNEVINQRLIIIDNAYAKYITDLGIEKKQSDMLTGLGGIMLGIAGTLTDSVAAKTNYAATGTLLAGGAALADKTVYFEQTIRALVAAMDASRSQVRLDIYRSMEKDTTEYTSSAAYYDLVRYERAGTLLSAIAFVQSTSKNSQEKADEEIREIVKLTVDQRQEKTCSSRSLFASNPLRNHANLIAAAKTLQVELDTNELADDEKIAAKLRQLNRDANSTQVADIFNALKSNGLITSCP